ncbi:MAG TPA: metallophosphoesterase, partial [Gemmataceae bacterium]|nr:metallophosphoesterase [Gemmataceae bacterium]
LPLPASVLLFAAACVGHLCLVLASHNRWYGSSLSKQVVHAIQALHALVLFAGPIALIGLVGLELAGLFDEPHRLWKAGLLAYLFACWSATLVGLPLATIRRLARKQPAALLSNHTRTVDVAGQLGYLPMGRGFWRHLTRLPGNDVFRVDFTQKRLGLARLPAAWDGLTILHLSDLHLNGTPDRRFFEHVMDECRAWNPDLVALSGDIVDDPEHHRWIVPVLGRLKWRIAAFAILGNHDSWYDVSLIRRRVRRCGMHLLGNSWTRIDVLGKPLVVIGNETPWFTPGPDLSDCPDGPFRLCLSHTPDNIAWARARGIDLMLSGHVHGGQVRLPLVGSLVVPSRYGRKYDCGTFDEPPTVLHVSRGLSGQEPLRINCRPEVTKLVLEPSR